MSNSSSPAAMSRKRLQRKRILEIRKTCENKLVEFGYESGPIDMTKFASFLGASVKYAPYDDGDLAGMLVRQKDQRPVIAVNSSHHPNRRRFTIAHECGHLLLHNQEVYVDEKLSVQKRDENSGLAVSLEEIEANQFAAEILMPFRNIVQDIDALDLDIEDETDTIALAKKYKVSRQAMSYRIYNVVSELIFKN